MLKSQPASTPEPLAAKLGYTFRDLNLLDRALTHSSYSRCNNEQLECLGDAVLSLVIIERLVTVFPHFTEGRLQQHKASLVCNLNLFRIAMDIDLGSHLNLGASELGSGGRTKRSILADALEAIIGAAYLDGGLPAAKSIINHLI